MITDKLLKVSSAQAVTATANSTDVIDLSQNRDVGAGEDVYFHFSVDESVAAAGAATVDLQVVVSDAAALTSPVVVACSGSVAKAELVAGKRIALCVSPMIESAGKRYMGVRYVVGTGPLTAGKFTAQVVKDVQDYKVYPVGSVVL